VYDKNKKIQLIALGVCCVCVFACHWSSFLANKNAACFNQLLVSSMKQRSLPDRASTNNITQQQPHTPPVLASTAFPSSKPTSTAHLPQYPSAAHHSYSQLHQHGGASMQDHEGVAIELEPLGNLPPRSHGGANGGDTEALNPTNPEIFQREYTVNGKRVRLIPAYAEGPCGTFAGIQTVMMAILALVIINILLMITLACVGYFYVYPNTIELVDDKIKNAGELAINLAVKNSGPVIDMVECVIGIVGMAVNDALGPLLGAEIDFTGGSNATLAMMCPLTFAGINRTVSSETMDEVLGSSFETSVPSFRSQLHDLKYGDTDSSPENYSPVHYLSSSSSSETDTTDSDTT
jgi:hypothetical protein